MKSSEQRIAKIERLLLAVFDELGFDAPPVYELATASLIEMGLDSLSVAHLREAIAEDLGCEIPASLFGFELDTIRKCAEYIATHGTRRDSTEPALPQNDLGA